MRTTFPRVAALSAIVLAVGASVLSPAAANAAGSTYYPFGPQVNVPVSTLTDAGWTECWQSPYDYAGHNITSILDGTDNGLLAPCDGEKFILTGWNNNDPSTLVVLAAAPKAAIFTETPRDQPRYSNGSYWYFTHNASIGFAPNANVSQNSCDIAGLSDGTQAQRLCWHLNVIYGGDPLTISKGWSLGANAGLNFNTNFTRAIFTLRPQLSLHSLTAPGAFAARLGIPQPDGGAIKLSVDYPAEVCRVVGVKLLAVSQGTCNLTVTSYNRSSDVVKIKSVAFEIK